MMKSLLNSRFAKSFSNDGFEAAVDGDDGITVTSEMFGDFFAVIQSFNPFPSYQ